MSATKMGAKAETDGASREESERPIPHFTVAERAAMGKAARAQVPRKTHAEWEPPPARIDPVELLEEQAKTRVVELVPIRYGRMLTSPFAFYRGAAAIMAGDLAPTRRTGLRAQLCGDAHLSNFGFFAAPDRDLVFSVNDFDETLPGPWEWDVKRLAASFAIAGREHGLDDAARRKLVLGTVAAYRRAMWDFAAMRDVDVWYARLDAAGILNRWAAQASKRDRKALARVVAKAKTKDSMRALRRLTRRVDGRLRIVGDPPLIVPIEELATDMDAEELEAYVRSLVDAYSRSLPGERRTLLERYRYVHVAHKVVGVGSVGTRTWIVLLVGRDDDDPLFLQLKEAEASVLEEHLGASQFSNHGQRVVEGQRLMQAASDIFIGWFHNPAGLDGRPRDFYIRQLWDWKGSADVEARPPAKVYGEICAWTLARAHARSGDAVSIASYLGKGDVVDRALASFAEVYADQNERDYEALKAAADSGRIAVQTGL